MRNFKYIIAFLNIPRLIPHCILFAFFYDKCKDDIIVAIRQRKFPLHDRMGGVIWDFLYLMVFDVYYRALFYKRIGHLKYLISFFAPAQETFLIGTYMPVGKGFLCVHPYATQINARSVGDYFIVKNGVTIGDKNGGVPTIGNHVLINVNSVVVGDIKIGNNVIIGACSLIMKDVPDNCVVAGNPAYIIRKNGVPCKEKL